MYYSDKPILTSEEDSLKHKYFVQLMAKALVNLQNADTFTIGLYGIKNKIFLKALDSV
jgi:hypothetical protein